MELQLVHDKLDDIPEQYRDLYTERDGKFHCTGIGGIKTQADIDRIMAGLTKEKDEHKVTREKYRPWSELGIELKDVTAKLDRYTELEVAASGNKEEMDKRLEELTEARVVSRLAPVEREHKTLQEKYGSLEEEVLALRQEKKSRTISDSVRLAAKKAGTQDDALQDIEIVSSLVFDVLENGDTITKENPYGFAPGLSPDLFFQEAKPLRPLWWEPTVGGGAGGSGGGKKFGDNPFSKDHWNLTAQGAIVREHGTERANAMAKSAGTSVGGPKPV